MRKIAVLGSTGSIGLQTLDVVRQHPNDFKITALSCFSNTEKIINQITEFSPTSVCVGDEKMVNNVTHNLPLEAPNIYHSEKGLLQMIDDIDADIFVIAIVGFAALKPTLHAIKKNKIIALANKESLVVAGKIVMDALKNSSATIYPVDSEHSAIFQSLQGENLASIEKIILTASGGPFRTYNLNQLAHVSLADAIQHPNWKMGDKITIDSATMINKGFEVIEAKWLFDVNVDQIEILVHPQSIVHSAVQFKDGSVKAQLGTPDMRLPIQYALYFPTRHSSTTPRIEWNNLNLSFEKPDWNKFPCLNISIQSIKKGGNMPCIVNAANEVANLTFRKNKCRFIDIPKIIEDACQSIPFIANPTLDELFQTHNKTITRAKNFLNEIQ